MRPEKNHRPPAGPSGGPGSNGGGATSRRLLRSTLTGSPDTLHAYDAFGRQAAVAHTAVWDPAEPAATRPLLLQTPSGWHTYSFDQVKEQKSAKLKPKVQGDRDFEAVRTYGARSGIPRRSGNCYVTELFDPSGNIAATYDFGPFGEDMAASGPAAALNPFRFSSEVWDAALGLVQYTFRPYNPLDGRFLNRDPVGEEGGLNLYGFVGNDPINLTDFLGMACVSYSRDAFEKWLASKGIPVDADQRQRLDRGCIGATCAATYNSEWPESQPDTDCWLSEARARSDCRKCKNYYFKKCCVVWSKQGAWATRDGKAPKPDGKGRVPCNSVGTATPGMNDWNYVTLIDGAYVYANNGVIVGPQEFYVCDAPPEPRKDGAEIWGATCVIPPGKR